MEHQPHDQRLKMKGRGVPILFLIDSADLELPILDKSFATSSNYDDGNDANLDVESSSLKLALVSSSFLWSHRADTAPLDLGNNYFCLHDFGIHQVNLPWVNIIRGLYSSPLIETNSNSGELYLPSFSIVTVPSGRQLLEVKHVAGTSTQTIASTNEGRYGKRVLVFESNVKMSTKESPDSYLLFLNWLNILNLLEKLRSNMCTVEYLLLTQSLSSQSYDTRSPGRAIIGLLPHKISGQSSFDTDTTPALTVVFPSKPEVVTVPLLCGPFSRSNTVGDLPSVRCEQWVQSLEEKDCKPPPKSSSCCPKESDFVKKCRRSLKAAESSRLPILSSLDDGVNLSEPKVFRLFLSATDRLRISQLSQLAGLAASVCRYAEYAEGQLAAQSEEVAGLAAQREALQTGAARLADCHSRILERQEALNNRLSELARRIYSIDAGLTDAELEMRSGVQNLRDRLKSGLLGWLENIRLQYDHLVTRLREQQRVSIGLERIERSRGLQASSLSPAQVENLVTMLKTEASEINTLVKAVERLNLLSTAAAAVPP